MEGRHEAARDQGKAGPQASAAGGDNQACNSRRARGSSGRRCACIGRAAGAVGCCTFAAASAAARVAFTARAFTTIAITSFTVTTATEQRHHPVTRSAWHRPSEKCT